MSRTKKVKIFKKNPAWKKGQSISHCDGCYFDENDNCTISNYPEYAHIPCIVNGNHKILKEVVEDEQSEE